jgi:vitamin B12 transporter
MRFTLTTTRTPGSRLIPLARKSVVISRKTAFMKIPIRSLNANSSSLSDLCGKLAMVMGTAALALIADTAIGQAQGFIRGTVSDPLGAVVKDVKVTLERGDTSIVDTSTDGAGQFTFASISPGRYHVEAQASGFARYVGPEVFVSSNGTTIMDVLLQISALKDETVVSATGSEIPISQVGASVSLIDSEEIQAENKLDVLEDLRQVSGAQIVQTSQRGGSTSLFIRGGESSFNKILIDGVPANDIGGAFDFAQLSNGGVDSVEVLKGANSVLYGADGLAGVVNITTQRGSSTIPELKLSVDGGNFGTLNQSASLSGAFHQFDYFSLFSRFDTQGSYPNDFFHNATYVGNFGWKPTARTDLRVTYRRNWTDLGLPNGLLLYGIPDDSLQKNQNTYLSATLQDQTTSRWHNLFRFAYGQFETEDDNPSPTGTLDPYGFGNYLGNVVTIKGANAYSVTGQAILDFAGTYPQAFTDYEARRSAYAQSDYQVFKEWTVTFGFRYEHEDGSGITRDNYSYFMEGHGNVAHRLYLTAGVGLDKNAVFGFAASPRVGAAYYLRRPTASSFFAETKLRFNFGTGIKEPSTFEQSSQLFALFTPAQRAQYGVGPVGPERSRTTDVGIDQGLWHGRARLQLTYFQNHFFDLITFLDAPELVSIGVNPAAAAAANASQGGAYVNASSTRAKGSEVQFVTDLGLGLRLQANYTYLDAVVTKAFGSPSFNPAFPAIPIGAFSPLQGARPFRLPPHTGSLALIYNHRKFTGAFTGYMVSRGDDSTFLYDGQYGTSMLLPNRDLDPAYQKFDLSGRYAMTSYVSAYVSMENLLSEHYQPVFGFPALPFTIRGGLTFTIGGENWRK